MAYDFTPRSWFRIGEVSKILEVEPHVVRYWQLEFGIRLERSKSGQRIFSRKTLDLLLRIRHLLYVEEYTIKGAKRRLVTPETCPHCRGELATLEAAE